MGIKGSIVGEYFNVDVDKSNSLPIPPEKKLNGWFAGEVLESKYYNYIFNQLDGNIGQLEQKALQVTYNQFPNRLFYLLGSQLTDFVSGRQPTDYSNNMTIIPIDQNFSKINETNLKVTIGPYCIDLDSTTDKLEYTDLLPADNYVYIASIANNAGGASTSSDVFIVIKNGGTFSKYKNGVADTFNFTESNDIAQIINGLYTSNQYRISNLSIIDFDGSDFDDGGGGINLQTVEFVSSIKNRFEIEFEGEKGNVPFSVAKRNSNGTLDLSNQSVDDMLNPGGLDGGDTTRNDTQGRALNWEQLGISDSDFSTLDVVGALNYIESKMEYGQSVEKFINVADSPNFVSIFPDSNDKHFTIFLPRTLMIRFEYHSYNTKNDGERIFFNWNISLQDTGYYEKANTSDLPVSASATVEGIMKVLNILDSTDNLSSLSAAQGKVLNEKIVTVNENMDDITLSFEGSVSVGSVTLNQNMGEYRYISFETGYGNDLIAITDFRVEIFSTSSISNKIRINNSSDLVPRELDLYYVDPTTIAISYAENTILKKVRFYDKKEII